MCKLLIIIVVRLEGIEPSVRLFWPGCVVKKRCKTHFFLNFLPRKALSHREMVRLEDPKYISP
jgi:hypothetical protein